VDFVCADQQHGLVEPGDLATLFAAIEEGGAAPLTRLAANDPAQIMRSLVHGGRGVIVPLVETGAQAAAAVAACRYPPRGTRSWGPLRAAQVLGSRQPAVLDADPLCIVMVETRDGLDNVDEIAATPGLDAIFVGPSDLALALGLPPSPEAGPEHQAALDAIRAAGARHGVPVGVHCNAGALAARRSAEGFAFVTIGEDHALLARAVAHELAAARPDA
jgi:4-hydroxy-2-oxoheptanedioate aldolase